MSGRILGGFGRWPLAAAAAQFGTAAAFIRLHACVIEACPA
jgi:hypothetical protein